MRPGAKRFPRRYSAVLCASLLAEVSVLEEALGATSFSEEEALSLLEELEVSLFASELEAVSDLDSAFDSLAEVLWLSAWDELAASLVLEALEDELPDEALAVSYTHLRAHETDSYLVCRLLLEKKKKAHSYTNIINLQSSKEKCG